MNLLFVTGVGLFVALFAEVAGAQEKAEKPRVIVTQTDEDAIRKLLKEFREHTEKPDVSLRSDTASYLDCPAHAELLKHGWKAVPYLIDQAARQQSVEATLGAALIQDAAVKTPEEVAAWNAARRARIAGDTLPPFVLATVLLELPLAKEDATAGQPEKVAGTKFVGIRHSDSYAWVNWWAANRDRFKFETRKPLALPEPEKGVVYGPHVTTTAKDGLLDIHAVDVTFRDILERGAAELGVEVFLGDHQMMEILTSTRMKGVTFEEFVHLLGRLACVGGFPVERTKTGWRVGGEQPAKPRAKMNGWGIRADRTVFRVGDKVPVTVIPQGETPTVDPTDTAFKGVGSFRVTTNDGRIVADYRKPTRDVPQKPPEPRRSLQLSLDDFCTLPAGEYNVSFRYGDRETPTVAIEIYDAPGKK